MAVKKFIQQSYLLKKKQTFKNVLKNNSEKAQF